MLLIGIGGSGRQSLARLAAYICDYKVFQLEVTRGYRKQEFREGECTAFSILPYELRVVVFCSNAPELSVSPLQTLRNCTDWRVWTADPPFSS